VLINPKSGAKKGQLLLEYGYEMVQIKMDNNNVARMHMVDITDIEKKFKAMKEMS
jgi:hypothetical protein